MVMHMENCLSELPEKVEGREETRKYTLYMHLVLLSTYDKV